MLIDKSKALPFPTLVRCEAASRMHFWLAAWFRDEGMLEALIAFLDQRNARARRHKSEVFAMAAISAECALRHEAWTSIKTVRDEGGLLFAWHGTTALQLQQRQTEAVSA